MGYCMRTNEQQRVGGKERKERSQEKHEQHILLKGQPLNLRIVLRLAKLGPISVCFRGVQYFPFTLSYRWQDKLKRRALSNLCWNALKMFPSPRKKLGCWVQFWNEAGEVLLIHHYLSPVKIKTIAISQQVPSSEVPMFYPTKIIILISDLTFAI